MSKEEFLQGLQEALSGNVPPSVVRENMQYYNDYLTTEISKGRTEQEVLDELGDPRLIARTIIDTTPGAGDGAYQQVSHDDQTSYGSQGRTDDRTSGNPFGGNVHYYDLSKWYWKLLGIVIVVSIICVIFTIVTGLLTLVIPLLPVIGIVILIMWFVQGPRR